MKNVAKGFQIIILTLLVFTTGCAHSNAFDKEEMYTLSAALTKLTAAVEEKVYFKEAPAEMKDMELVNFSITHDPRLKEPFAEYFLKVQGVDGHAIVLICDKSGTRGLIEDGGCTSAVDKHWWQDKSSHPCVITITICQAK